MPVAGGKIPLMGKGPKVIDGETWDTKIAPALMRKFLVDVQGGFLTSTPGGLCLVVKPGGTSQIIVMFDASLTVGSFYQGFKMSGTPTGPFPEGLTIGDPCYIQNLNEYALGAQWPTQPGEPGIGTIFGQFTDPDTGITLDLVTVDHPSRGSCTPPPG